MRLVPLSAGHWELRWAERMVSLWESPSATQRVQLLEHLWALQKELP